MLLPLAGLLVGVLLGLVLNVNVGFELSRYSAVAILAALDSVLGAVRAELDGVYDNRVFISGFVTHAVVAVILGAIVLGEPIDLRTVIAGSIIVAAVALIVTARGRMAAPRASRAASPTSVADVADAATA